MLLPENLTRLQATAFVNDAALDNPTRCEIIRTQAKQMAEMAIRKVIKDCIKTHEYQGHMGQTLYLDVFILAPEEMYALIKDARTSGADDYARACRY